MKIYQICIALLMLLPITMLAQSNSKVPKNYLDKISHIKIDKIVYYETPYATVRNKPLETTYKPDWYWAYCASSYPLAFNNFAKEANKYFASDFQQSEIELQNYEKDFKEMREDQFETPYEYHYGDIYFTDKKSNKQYLMTLTYRFIKEFQNLDFVKLDTLRFKNPKVLDRGKSFKELNPNEAIIYLPTTSSYYTLEDGIYKAADIVNIHKNVLGEGNTKSFIKGKKFGEFNTMLRRASNYIRSRIESGDRVFETVKQTPKGIVVIGKKRKQLDENNSNKQ